MNSNLPTWTLFRAALRASALLCCALVFPAAIATIEGVVVARDGTPIEHAEISSTQTSKRALSDGRGRFTLELTPPAQVRIRHARFREARLEISETSPTIVLELKFEHYEEVAVSAKRDGSAQRFAPVSVATTVIDPQQTIAPASVREIVAQTPGVSENGQGGLFQNYSVRGTSRQRVLTLVSGMRIITERRAGASASFIDPNLLDALDVVRGPASTYYGSGALGGVLQLIPRRFAGWSARAGYDSSGDESHNVLGYGSENWGAGLAFRRANNAEAPTGQELNSGFSQISSVIQTGWKKGESSYQFEFIGSNGNDIGKANTDFPARTTVYPQEGHALARFSYDHSGRWHVDAYTHPNSLITRVDDAGETSVVRNRAVDLGLNLRREFDVSWAGSARAGFDYFGRRKVNAHEISPTVDERTLRDGEEDELGLYGALEFAWGRASVLAGGRFAAQRQKNDRSASRDESALTGFLGLVVPVGTGIEVVANAGSGLRFPTLSESFFSGTTGRGQVLGNPALDPERSVNADVGVRWFGERVFVSGYLFRNEIDDYIERVTINPDLRTFVNLQSGTIEGVELDGYFKLGPQWTIQAGGHAIDGEAGDGSSLADIPADSVYVGAAVQRGKVRAELRWEHRNAKTDPGSGEMPIPSAELVSGAVEVSLSQQLDLSLHARNLLDDTYFNSADDSVPLAPGRSIGISLRWRANPR